jgi:hypothetical protein
MPPDLVIPEDRTVKVRILQDVTDVIGKGSNPATLRIIVNWIEGFGVLHMLLGIMGAVDFLPEQGKIRVAVVANISDAGRQAVRWVDDTRHYVLKKHSDLPTRQKFELNEVWATRAASLLPEAQN